MHDDSASVVKAGTDLTKLVQELLPFCDAGMVADIDLVDGTSITAVLIGVSSSALILDRWDGKSLRPASNPFTLALDLVSQVVIP